MGNYPGKLESIHHYNIVRHYQDEMDLHGDKTPTLDAVQVAGAESEWKDCRGKYKILLSPELSASNINAKVRVILRDGNLNVIGRMYSEILTIRNTARDEDIRNVTYYHGQGDFALTLGAKWYKLVLIENVSGFLTVYSGEI